MDVEIEKNDKALAWKFSTSILDPEYFNRNDGIFVATSVDISGVGLDLSNFVDSIPKDIVLVVDRSGSMGGVMSQVKKMCKMVTEVLKENDRISIVEFDHEIKVSYVLSPCEAKIHSVIDSMNARGSTNISDGLIEGLKQFKIDESFNRAKILILLSDGSPNQGISDAEDLYNAIHDLVSTPPYSMMKLSIHTFGFTQNHEVVLMKRVSDVCGGMYYFCENDDDIPASIGDCFGTISSIVAVDINLNANIYDDKKLWNICFYESIGSVQDSLSEETTTHTNIGTISLGQRISYVLLCYVPTSLINTHIDELSTPSVEISLKYRTPLDQSESIEQKFIVNYNELLSNIKQSDVLHIGTHVCRINVSFGLNRALDPAAHSIVDDLVQLHDFLLQVMGQLQEIETEEMKMDEGILSALERDLGAAIEGLHFHPRMSSRMRALFLQFSQEHRNQRSASSASNVRSTYSTETQQIMRSRFLSGKANSEKEELKEKESIPLNEEGLLEEEIKKRKSFEDDECCFVSLSNWRECTLGLGLLVRPRTARERFKKLMPVIELVEDYISADSYNSGIRVNFSKPSATVDREAEDDESHIAVKSSTRCRINGWLPLYINEINWKYAKHYAISAFSIIATQFNDMFKPEYAFKVCAKLMIQTIVKFTLTEQKMSEKAIQMFADVHRLFLQVAKEYPNIREAVEEQIGNFITSTSHRNRKNTPDLGDMIQYLSITNKYTWKDLKEVYMIEAIRRSALHLDIPNFNHLTSVDELIQYWEENAHPGRVTRFCVMFLNIIAAPEGFKIDDVIVSMDVIILLLT
eukprot:TRINITY_DN2781_c0_g1_i5.p1 TRINITY_DN2781_c0_g1~~TRINITY_DN2781_c0_g1_i5.p1  ORF type:complete len:807 (+),score=132.72 TRINITY_DN2781_c0_g1_i5:32-2452(+)